MLNYEGVLIVWVEESRRLHLLSPRLVIIWRNVKNHLLTLSTLSAQYVLRSQMLPLSLPFLDVISESWYCLQSTTKASKLNGIGLIAARSQNNILIGWPNIWSKFIKVWSQIIKCKYGLHPKDDKNAFKLIFFNKNCSTALSCKFHHTWGSFPHSISWEAEFIPRQTRHLVQAKLPNWSLNLA